MKTKTIAKILAGKHAAWCKSITDDAVRKAAEENTIITGGAIVSLLTNEPVNDFDVYFRTHEAALTIAQYYVKKLLENPPPAFKDTPDHKVEIFAKLEPAIAEGCEALRVTGMTKGPQEPRVRVVVKSAGVAGATEQKDYQYFEGIQDPNRQAQATDAYIGAAVGEDVEAEEYAEGQVTDESEPGAALPKAYAAQVEDLDDEPAAKVTDGEVVHEQEVRELKPDKGGKREKYRVLFMTSNAITLSDQMQLVLRFQGEPDKIHENFDFTHVLSYWTSWGKEVVLNPQALECIINKELKYQGSRYPICSIIRLRKFIKRGWTVNAGQIVKMAYQVSELDLNDPMVLEDQLVGVDSAYFSQLLTKLREQSDPHHVDGTYLMTLIDRIF